MAETLGIMHLDKPSPYSSSREDSLVMIQTTDWFSYKDTKPSSVDTKHFYRNARGFLDELHVCHLEEEKEKFPTFALLLETKI